MNFFDFIFKNHHFANVSFCLVLLIGWVSYDQMPREQDPEINFNFVSVLTFFPGASLEDVEDKITIPLENAIKNISGVKYVSSNSRESVSRILIRFEDVDQYTFDKYLYELRSSIQNAALDQLPEQAKSPKVTEITTSNGFPTALLIVQGEAFDDTLRYYSKNIKADIEGISGVNRVSGRGISKPDLLVEFSPELIASRGVGAIDISNSISNWYQSGSAGVRLADDLNWLISIEGGNNELDYLTDLPIRTNHSYANNYVALSDIAEISKSLKKPTNLAFLEGKPGVLLGINKQSNTNTIELVERINKYIEAKNRSDVV